MEYFYRFKIYPTKEQKFLIDKMLGCSENPTLPKSKKESTPDQSYIIKCVDQNIQILENAVALPRLGTVECFTTKQIQGQILTATVSRTADDKYFVSLSCSDVFVCVPDSEDYKRLVIKEKKLAKLQRQLSRKEDGSNRRDKAEQQIAKLQRRIEGQRKEMLRKERQKKS